jgi:hypothetical protein
MSKPYRFTLTMPACVLVFAIGLGRICGKPVWLPNLAPLAVQDFKFNFKIARIDGHFRPSLRKKHRFYRDLYSSAPAAPWHGAPSDPLSASKAPDRRAMAGG